MAAMLETPSRIWRRIEAVEGQDMPSLPSLPAFEDSADQSSESQEDSIIDLENPQPIHSTPAAFSSHTMTTIRASSSTSSTARFAQSIASRSSKSALSVSRGSVAKQPQEDSFNISSIPSLPDGRHDIGDLDIRSSDQDTEDSSLPEDFSPPDFGHDVVEEMDRDMDLSDALQSLSRPNSPQGDDAPTPRKKYDYSVSLRSEKKPSPFDKLRNVSFRRPLSRTRTPSLTRTTPSPSSSSAHSTPQSNHSIAYPRSMTASPFAALSVPLPRSATASPAVGPSAEENHVERMDAGELSHSEMGHDESRDEMDLTGTLPHDTDVSGHGQEEHREPTFSSEAPTQSDHEDERGLGTPAPLSTAFSSPAPSAMFTPTPAFQSRPRARFGAPVPTLTPQPQQLMGYTSSSTPHGAVAQEQEEEDEDPATPHAHKRSFLLSVINSTARPRLKYPTPHPQRGNDDQHGRVPMTPGVNLQAAFAGVTPRPQLRPRLSHPLTQTWAVPPSESGSGSGSESASASESRGQSHSPIPPGAQSPYDPSVDRISFVSTASSHDLAAHARANASFDPVMGLGEHGHGVGRFNAGKLNNYLHGLNRRLQEENETLVFRLKTYEDKYGKGAEAAIGTTPQAPPPAQQPYGRRLSGGSRRVGAGPGIGLGDVAEDVAEGWIEEKAALEELVEELKDEVGRCTADKEIAEEALSQEKNERARDKERWRERMVEVEKGVSEIIQDLEQKLAKAEEEARELEKRKVAEVKEIEKRLASTVAEKEMLQERAKQAEDALESGKELGTELNAMSERVSQVMADLRNSNTQVQELEDEVMRADEKIDDLEKELREAKQANVRLQGEVQTKTTELDGAFKHIEALDEDMRKMRGDLQESRAYAAQLDTDAVAAVERIEGLEAELRGAQEKIEDLMDDIDRENQEVRRLSEEYEMARQLEDALQAAESKSVAEAQEIASLKSKLAAMEREREQSKSHVSQAELATELQGEIETLEAELDDARKEVARLNTLVNQSPARKAIDKAKDARIEMLEREKEDLLERIKSIKGQNSLHSTPAKIANSSGISPMHRQILALSMKSPKTPGGPLRDLSWLHNTLNDPTVSPLVAEIARLQQELDRANESIDDKLDKLEDAGLGVVGLTELLEDARARIRNLEDEIARLTRREERRYHRLQRARCLKCRSKVDLRNLHRSAEGDESSLLEESDMSLPSEPPTPPTKTSEALRANLQKVNARLASMKKSWDEEKRRLLGEKAVLQDTANRLNAQVRDANNEMKKLAETGRVGEKARAGIQGELDDAKRVIDDLEAELKAERARLRTLTTEQSRAQREKDNVTLQLRRTESDITDVKEQLQRLKQENHELEAELRTNSMAEQKARLLETKVSENVETIEQLRHERSLLAADYKELQTRYSKVSEHVGKLQDEYAASQTSHDQRRHELDLRLLEIEDLRRALSSQAEELHRVELEKIRIAAEKSDVASAVAALEADLHRVRKDAEAFGRDLKLLRAQKDRLEEERKSEQSKAARSQKQSETQIRLLKEELQSHREKVKTADERFRNHVCVADEGKLASLKLQHNKECKGLIVQIRYLKAKFTRESGLRCDLGYQKQYLLILLAQFERNEQKILAAIARIGFPASEPPHISKRRTLRSVALSVMFILRSKRASDAWREETAAKEAIAAALQEVRRRRIADKDKQSVS